MIEMNLLSDENYFPKYVYWELSNYCNLKCKHCFADATGNINTVANKEKICSKIEELNRIGSFAIRFGGGEPLLVKELFEIINFCKLQNIPVDITTNGLLLCKDILSKLHLSGLRDLTISIDGLEKTHDYIRGSGTYQKAHQSIIQALNYKKINVSIAITVNSHNYHEITKIVEHFISIGIEKFYLFRYCDNKNALSLKLNRNMVQNIAMQLIILKQKHPNIKLIQEGFAFYLNHFNSNTNIKEGCNFLNNIMTVKYNGDIVVCAAINKILGNIYTEPLYNILEKIKSEKKSIRVIPKECFSCIHSFTCHGGCKSYSYSHNFDFIQRDPLCPY